MGLLAQVESSAVWYHTLDLGFGVVTPGIYDLRKIGTRAQFPTSFEGKRCLDVGTADGYWAFEMERRGALEVVATDVNDASKHDWPATINDPKVRSSRSGQHDRNFAIAKTALRSRVQKLDISPYDLNPATLGYFDFVFMGSILLHLRDPHRALAAVRTVTRGELLSNDVFSLGMTVVHPLGATSRITANRDVEWAIPNYAGLRRYYEAAGFDIISMGLPYRLPFGVGFRGRGHRLLRSPLWRVPWPGLATVSVRLRPAGT